MAKVVESFEYHTMDFTARVQAAKSATGKCFRRIMGRDSRYGYKWGAWREIPASSLEGKFNLGPQKWRLPA